MDIRDTCWMRQAKTTLLLGWTTKVLNTYTDVSFLSLKLVNPTFLFCRRPSENCEEEAQFSIEESGCIASETKKNGNKASRNSTLCFVFRKVRKQQADKEYIISFVIGSVINYYLLQVKLTWILPPESRSESAKCVKYVIIKSSINFCF